jgi:hypothetical protein
MITAHHAVRIPQIALTTLAGRRDARLVIARMSHGRDMRSAFGPVSEHLLRDCKGSFDKRSAGQTD